MKTTVSLQKLVAAGCGLAVAALLSGSAMADSGDRKAIEKRLGQYAARFNQGDPEAVAALFAEDVVYYGPLGKVYEGREAVETRYRRSLEAGFKDMRVEALEIRVLGDTAYDVARYTITSPAGDPLSGYHLAVMEKKDGKWIVRRTLVNAKMPGPPAE